jgi:hypothetical protein
MKIVKHLLILTLGLSFVACSGKSDNKDENNGKIIEKPESACDCAKNAVVVLEELIDDLENKDDLSRSEINRIAEDWKEDLEDSKWFKICEQKYEPKKLDQLKNCEASEQLKRVKRKMDRIERRFSGKEEPKREEYKGEGEGEGEAYDGSEYESSEYDGPADAPDAYDGE